VIGKRKGCGREAGSEGSVEQRREPMDKNRIGGLRRRTNWPRTAKSTPIQGAGGQFGGCAWKAVSLIAGDLLRVRESGLRVEPFTLSVRQESAEGTVAAPAAKARTIGRVRSAGVSRRVVHSPSRFGGPLVGTAR
jgi:hypothetical protein